MLWVQEFEPWLFEPGVYFNMYREIAGTDKLVRAVPGVRDSRVRATKGQLYLTARQ